MKYDAVENMCTLKRDKGRSYYDSVSFLTTRMNSFRLRLFDLTKFSAVVLFNTHFAQKDLNLLWSILSVSYGKSGQGVNIKEIISTFFHRCQPLDKP